MPGSTIFTLAGLLPNTAYLLRLMMMLMMTMIIPGSTVFILSGLLPNTAYLLRKMITMATTTVAMRITEMAMMMIQHKSQLE